jgi:hypothetical protein
MPHDRWTEQDVKNILLNPLYVGLGPTKHVPLVSEADWIRAVITVTAAEEGSWDSTLKTMQSLMIASLGHVPQALQSSTWRQHIIAEDPTTGLQALLRDLRAELDPQFP